jgi:hypothetical protein
MLLIGRKLWILFPPDIDETELNSATSLNCDSKEDDAGLDFCAAGWIIYILSNLPVDVYSRRVQFVQQQGETIFVPEGCGMRIIEQCFAHNGSMSLNEVCRIQDLDLKL